MSRPIALLVALLILAASGLFGIGAALGQLDDTASPAQGRASVIAQGVAAMGDGELGWRVTRASTPQQAETPSRGDPGFLLAESGALLINHLDTAA